jgi:DNA-binding transcriptional LysR family regulator
MRFQKLDLNLLFALDVLLTEKSITRTARKLNLSQSATSSILARLRDYFDDPILVQVGRSMVPSELAIMLHQPVRKLLLEIQSTLEIRPQFVAAAASRHFRIVASDYTVSVVLSRVIQQLYVEAPGMTMEITTPSQESLAALSRGEADLAFIPKGMQLGEHQSEVLFSETDCCAVWASNTVVGDHITLDQYLDIGHVATRFVGATSVYEDQFFLHSRKVQVTANTFTALPQLLIGTNRVATLHTRLARQLARYFPIRLLPLPFEQPALELLMQWHEVVDQDPAHRWLRSLVRAAALAEPLAVEGY